MMRSKLWLFIVAFVLIFVFTVRWMIEWTQDEIGYIFQLCLTHAVVHVPGFIAFLLLVFTGGQILWVDLFTWIFRCIVGN